MIGHIENNFLMLFARFSSLFLFMIILWIEEQLVGNGICVLAKMMELLASRSVNLVIAPRPPNRQFGHFSGMSFKGSIYFVNLSVCYSSSSTDLKGMLGGGWMRN
jgi:hypothetical protein